MMIETQTDSDRKGEIQQIQKHYESILAPLRKEILNNVYQTKRLKQNTY